MALKSQRSSPWLSGLHLGFRLLGLAGLMAALLAVNLAHVQGGLPELEEAGPALLAALRGSPAERGPATETAYVFVAGLALLLLTLAIELVVGSRKAAFRRSALGA